MFLINSVLLTTTQFVQVKGSYMAKLKATSSHLGEYVLADEINYAYIITEDYAKSTGFCKDKGKKCKQNHIMHSKAMEECRNHSENLINRKRTIFCIESIHQKILSEYIFSTSKKIPKKIAKYRKNCKKSNKIEK